eukprot:scaffold37881_cov69-Phaeocystis_antarctica.AAC.3
MLACGLRVHAVRNAAHELSLAVAGDEVDAIDAVEPAELGPRRHPLEELSHQATHLAFQCTLVGDPCRTHGRAKLDPVTQRVQLYR